jgi:hypothetical protein
MSLSDSYLAEDDVYLLQLREHEQLSFMLGVSRYRLV